MNTLIMPLVMAVAMSIAAPTVRTSAKDVAPKTSSAAVPSVVSVAKEEPKDTMKDFSMKLTQETAALAASVPVVQKVVPAKPATPAKKTQPRDAENPAHLLNGLSTGFDLVVPAFPLVMGG